MFGLQIDQDASLLQACQSSYNFPTGGEYLHAMILGHSFGELSHAWHPLGWGQGERLLPFFPLPSLLGGLTERRSTASCHICVEKDLTGRGAAGAGGA